MNATASYRALCGDPAAAVVQHGASEDGCLQGGGGGSDGREGRRAVPAGEHARRSQPPFHLPEHVQVCVCISLNRLLRDLLCFFGFSRRACLCDVA